MQIHNAMLLTDWLIWGLALLLVVAAIWMHRKEHLRAPWRKVLHGKLSMVAMVVLLTFSIIGLLDSIHLHIDNVKANTSQTVTILDLIVSPLGQQDEKTYSAPFATHLYSKSLTTLPNGKEVRAYARLKHGGAHLSDPSLRGWDISWRIVRGFCYGLFSFLMIASIWLWILSKRHHNNFLSEIKSIWQGKTVIAWREAILTVGAVWIVLAILMQLVTHYHILGTDKIGRDVFYETINSIRTGLLIGTLTTLFMLPFALLLGTIAGFFGGWVDDIIQYLYTTLSSIPGVLLISATILVLQVYIANHPDLFPTLLQRADARLLALCMILGITSWASLCRLLRGETLKLRELEYIQASRAFGVRRMRIILRHVIPNVMHIVMITLVLDFSGLVLAEAVLSYVGVGVDPTTASWGNMINSSRLELAREPIVWWPLIAALILMFLLVLAANLFADSVRDAFDPRV